MINLKLKSMYNIDKLSLIYEIPTGFMERVSMETRRLDFMTSFDPHFVLDEQYSTRKRTTPFYRVSYRSDEGMFFIGQFRNDTVGSITLDVDNEFLYSGHLDVLYQFERVYGLTFTHIRLFDVCCDSNQNLPRKLNEILRSKEYEVCRRGSGKRLTNKNNQKLGKKTSENIKILSTIERPPVTYYFYLRPSKCYKTIVLRCYNKSEEIENSKKEYILDSLGFTGSVYRLEVSTFCYELTLQSKNKTGWSHQYIYEHLTDKDFLKGFFIKYINRFFTLKSNGISYSLSDVLRLEPIKSNINS